MQNGTTLHTKKAATLHVIIGSTLDLWGLYHSEHYHPDACLCMKVSLMNTVPVCDTCRSARYNPGTGASLTGAKDFVLITEPV